MPHYFAVVIAHWCGYSETSVLLFLNGKVPHGLTEKAHSAAGKIFRTGLQRGCFDL